ncbi:MAG TPA: hypothetical protein VNJ70_06420 [Thermoanaerobaculia bacterium]|nr:hypothetical protein [Thermoanaerobaculia bacterium]
MTEPPVPPTPPPPYSPTPPPYTPPPPPPGGGTVSPNRSLMIVLSYLGILALIPLISEKEDREVQWHAKHGLVLLGFWIVVSIVLSLLSNVIGFADPSGCLGCFWAGPSSIVGLAALVIHVLCIIKGINGERFIIPGISQLADKF